MRNRAGMISIVAIWVLVILTLLAVGLGRRAAIDLAGARYNVGKMKSKNLASAGVMVAAALLRDEKPAAGSMSTGCGSSAQCGVTVPEGKTADEVFSYQKAGEGRFDISYSDVDEAGKPVKIFGLQDEAGRLNLNAISKTGSNKGAVFQELLTVLGYGDSAEKILASLVEWRTPKDKTSPEAESWGKNGPLESTEELLLLKGMTPEIYKAVRSYVTVFPAGETAFKINWHAASPVVLKAWARVVARGQSKTADWQSVSDSLVAKVVASRIKNEKEPSSLNLDEESVWKTMLASVTTAAPFLRVNSRGIDERSGVRTDVEALIERATGKIVFWRRDADNGAYGR